ncbi:hypothetical protein SORBI_3010G140525 [Sorghum bicolor]|uniref:Uncharacterized protein n=1 Tax=Sorghum bicolor TaxID=4558 RepID=A0A1W0VSY3_SORBI|nr:hypothetical protein SORBI_3010G140525 [Sorghum bicolor]
MKMTQQNRWLYVLVRRRENPSSCHSVINCFRVHTLQIFPTSYTYRNRFETTKCCFSVTIQRFKKNAYLQ